MTQVADPGVPGYRAVATLYNALMTGLVLSLVSRRGATVAREFVFRHFRQQHLEKFLPGLKKRGLDGNASNPEKAIKSGERVPLMAGMGVAAIAG